MLMLQSCHDRARRREDCRDGQVKRRASHQCEDKKQRASMFCGCNLYYSDCLVLFCKCSNDTIIFVSEH